MKSIDLSVVIGASVGLGACTDRFPSCSAFSPPRVALSRALWPHHEIIQPRLGVTRLARALGIGVRSLDLWTCGPGLSPDKAASVAACFARLVDHMQKQAGRCTCRLCAPTPTERARERSWGGRKAGADRVALPLRRPCSGLRAPRRAS